MIEKIILVFYALPFALFWIYLTMNVLKRCWEGWKALMEEF